MRDSYQNPLCTRYAGKDMQRIFSDQQKFSTWRRLWLALAESEQALGLPITDAQLAEMRLHPDDIDCELAARKEKELRHAGQELPPGPGGHRSACSRGERFFPAFPSGGTASQAL